MTKSGSVTASTGKESKTQPQISRLLAVFAWVSFVLNTAIIGTGGAVRLTGSGLGCTDWPLCTPGNLVPTAEQSYHALIEFGNRTISGPLLLAAIVVFLLSWRIAKARKDLFILSAVVLFGVVLQAVVGGVIVWMHLNANLVGFHYVASLTLVCLTAAYLVRMKEPAGPRALGVPKSFAIVTHITTLAMAFTIYIGVLTTGAGPHSGDENVVRDGFDATLLSHVHAWPGYVLVALLLGLTVTAAVRRLPQLAWFVTLLIVTGVQILVGVYQARNGLPPLMVGIHMVLASLTAATMTVVVLRLKTTKQPVDR